MIRIVNNVDKNGVTNGVKNMVKNGVKNVVVKNVDGCGWRNDRRTECCFVG